MRRMSFFSDSGAALLLVAIMLPIFLALMGFVVDLGRLFVVKAKMQNMVDIATNAGASLVADEIATIVEEKKAGNPDLVIPEDITILLDDDDRARLYDLHSVEFIVYDYLLKNNHDSYDIESAEIYFPYEYSNGDALMKVRVHWQQPVSLYFIALFGVASAPITVESLSSMKVSL